VSKVLIYLFWISFSLTMSVVCLIAAASLYLSVYQKGQLDGCNASLHVHPKVKTLNLYCEQEEGDLWIGSMYTPELRIKIYVAPY